MYYKHLKIKAGKQIFHKRRERSRLHKLCIYVTLCKQVKNPAERFKFDKLNNHPYN